MGILFSLLALFSWGVGDFLIQRSARRFGNWRALFYITTLGSVGLLPFVYHEIVPAFSEAQSAFLLLGTSAVLAAGGYCMFEALRIGKISVVEPVFAFEIAVTGVLSALFIQEYPSAFQFVLILAVMAGIFLVSAKNVAAFKNIRWEKGVMLALAATALMGTANFLFGLSSRDTGPLMINWVSSVVIMVISLIVIVRKRELMSITSDLKSSPGLVFGMSVLDNLAWIFFTSAMLYIPIAIATSISEGYIVLAALLGLVLNRERLRRHQIFGLVFTIAAALALAAITKG